MKLSVSKIKRIVYNGHNEVGVGREVVERKDSTVSWILLNLYLILSTSLLIWGSNGFYKHLPQDSLFSLYEGISQQIITFFVAYATNEMYRLFCL